MKKGNVIIKNASQVITCSGFEGKFGKDMNNINVIENASVVVEDGIIKEIGSLEDILKKYNEKHFEIVDASNKAVLPGFVDSHTHFVFGGFRAEEFSWRLNGESYMDIMNKGGGIVNSVRGTREATEDELYESAKKRLDSMIHFGVTTVEGKSGYGLDYETELKQLRVMDRLQKDHSIDICKTFMGAHATPEEYRGRNEEYINFIIEDVLPKVAEEKLAEFCDVFCEEGVFSVEESRKILLKAKELGMKIKLHADEIVQLGGAELAAELGATSADHLLHASDEGIKAMADKKVIATLLPTTAFCLKEPFARARMMIDKGGAVALGTDFNPGSGFTNSIPLMFALATIYMDMSIEEAISAMTINGAAAIGRAETIGSIDKGKKGDLVILEYPSYKFLPYNTGVNIVETVIKDGNIVYKKSY
ncbi:imidazolonepropionase [Clostridium tetani]|uniref:Imidazolonepropionase n=1 Tax=Clostridium tetani (strain Massachusetts / E88) TaxID=212717 RepID=HUTI_CLOTE|nr:imidazolonepropionase [Clostridium tetani]Q891P9.1 RecName: Full=Imidazolonepropionase; AltName: Full=Imidazolone-5-propionate hydrolase [Clostridium tetani E88]AAO36796.1 imidazolonepropionase [Clostridium tetani E88]KGI41183.1 imidazolonepropionase [Clostridium tetani]KGI45931.1 imidazolonepropionase [Clostridium tetani]KHO31144.1 imidazolonepropionase [Clostridium tetani]KIG21325.1 imidazolonepropionase [Clostridium tetani]